MPNPHMAPEEEPIFTPTEMDALVAKSLKYGNMFQLLNQADKYDISVDGDISRSGRYVHQRSTTFELTWEYGEVPEDDVPDQFAKIANSVDADISAQVVDINDAIYRDLEKEHTYQFHGEGAEESIRANEYEFDENGSREDGTGLHYDDLDDSAQEKAKEWFSGSSAYEDWYESVLEGWKDRLMEMGFGSKHDVPEINFSGFWNQGDGASFTCHRFYLDRYAEYLALGKGKDLGI